MLQQTNRHALLWVIGLATVLGMPSGAPYLPGLEAEPSKELRALVEADWDLQEARLGRSPGDPAALSAAIERLERLLADRRGVLPPGQTLQEESSLARLHGLVVRVAELGEADRQHIYREIRWVTRRLALQNPLLGSMPIAFVKRRRFICQMLHEYLGYFYDYGDVAGGGVHVLEKPGRSLATRDLVGSRLGRGNFTTLSLSFEGRTLCFAFAPRAESRPDYYSPERRCFHIFSVGADGCRLRQLTDGPHDDFNPCELPDGSIAFLSTRRGGFGRCHNPWEPLPTYTLHRMGADGSDVRTLSYHETNEWHPSVLADGRIVYTRWDYVDRSAANFHGLWITSPDGSGAMAIFGNYTDRINACYQPRAIPGSDRIVFVAGAHHAAVGGSLVILDPARVRLHPETGEDVFDAIESLTPEVCFPEAPSWPSSYFHSPWPLSETYFLVSFSFDPLPGMGPQVRKDSETGIYLLDRFGNLELLYREPGISCMYPIPLGPRPVPPVLASTLEESLGDEGEFILTDVRRGHFALPVSRPIVELRVFQVLPKSETHAADRPRLGFARAESARMLLGTVPVEADGSAYFRAPARKPLYFQAVDGGGRAVQGMRSIAYLQSGERRGCVGCHEPRWCTPAASGPRQERQPLALRRAPSQIKPGPDGSRPWSFQRLVQPILEVRCVSCHGTGGVSPNLTAEPKDAFTRSYGELRTHVRWYEWGGDGIEGFLTTLPGHMPADESPLLKVLGDSNHAGKAQLAEDELRRLYLWLDGNASFYGTYSEAERLAQLSGEAVPPPKLQ